MSDLRSMILGLRNVPSNPSCDQCGKHMPINDLHPASGDRWICLPCYDVIFKEMAEANRKRRESL